MFGWPWPLFSLFGLFIVFGFRWAFGSFHPLMVFTGLVFVGLGLYLSRAMKEYHGRRRALLAGEGLLASWTCPDEDWARLQRRTLREQGRALLLVMAMVNALLLALFLWMRLPAGLAAVAGAVPNAIALTTLLPAWRRTRWRKVEVVVGRGGLLLGGRFFDWDSPGLFLQSVRFQYGPPAALEFTYRQSTGRHRTTEHLLVPVPRSHEQAAREVAARLG